jgi:hypothetical protein
MAVNRGRAAVPDLESVAVQLLLLVPMALMGLMMGGAAASR